MKSHLNSLIRILIVHIVDNVQCIYIQTSQPLHHIVILSHYIIIIEVIACNRTILRTYLYLKSFVNTAVDSIKQALSKVSSCTEELHFLTDPH